jgi:phage repressor protein C with HTH and peptisase S24 domain
VSKDWLTEGNDVPFPRETSHELTTVEDNGTRINVESAIGAPVYDIDVTAGCQELSRMFTVDRILGHLNMPSINPEHPLVRVSGNSMAPEICNGSYVQIRPISDLSPIFWGSTYVVVMEDYRMVKILRRHADRNKVILHSINPDYDDMEIDRLDIKKLYLVEAIFNYEIIS